MNLNLFPVFSKQRFNLLHFRHDLTEDQAARYSLFRIPKGVMERADAAAALVAQFSALEPATLRLQKGGGGC